MGTGKEITEHTHPQVNETVSTFSLNHRVNTSEDSKVADEGRLCQICNRDLESCQQAQGTDFRWHRRRRERVMPARSFCKEGAKTSSYQKADPGHRISISTMLVSPSQEQFDTI